MPNIVTYESKSELTPSDKGINAAADAARVYSRVGNQIAGDIHKVTDMVERHMAIMETSELYKTGTELKLNLQTRYEHESALPENRNDPHFGDRFMAEVGPLIDQWSKGAGTDHGKQLAATLGGSIRNEIFGHVAAGQSEMDAAHVQDNLTQTVNSLGSGLITDPSEINLQRTIGTAKDAIQGMTMSIPDVNTREQVASEFTARTIPQLVIARYNGVAEAAKNQIAETGGETSPALAQLNKDVASQLGFQYLSPEIQTRLSKLGDDAVRQGQELFNSKHATAKAQLTEEGKARYAEIHSVMTTLAMAGQGPTPDVIAAKDDFMRRYGGVLPGEVASLDDFIMRGQDRAQKNEVQPYDQQTRNNIQAGFSLPTGDPRRPTLASIARAYSHDQITKEDFTGYSEILNKLDKPETDPAFKSAWDGFVRWRDAQVQGIGGPNYAGTAAARAAFIHDATANFMARGRNGGDWDRALDRITDLKVPGNFGSAEIQRAYQTAAQRPDAANWLKSNWFQWNENGTIARGSTAAPIYPTGPSATVKLTPVAPTPAADLKKADEILWGKK